MINGNTKLIAHLGFPTQSFKAPMIYNPYFQANGINAVVVPMGCDTPDYPHFLRGVSRLSNFLGALVTMPHKVTTTGLVDELSVTARVAGSCNAVRLGSDGRLIGDMFDGEGFVRGALRKGVTIKGAKALVVGSGGVGSAIAASLANAGATTLALFDSHTANMEALAGRLRAANPALKVKTGSADPDGFDIVVNATPLGMTEGDPLPMDVSRIEPTTFVGEVVMKTEITPFLQAAADKGCRFQIGTDMLFEQIPAYLEFFGLPTTTPDELRQVAQISY